MNKKYAILRMSEYPDIYQESTHDTFELAEEQMKKTQLAHHSLNLNSVYYWIIVPIYTTLNNQ